MRSSLALALSLVFLAGAARGDSEAWDPSKCSAGDTLGAFNELSPERVVAAADS